MAVVLSYDPVGPKFSISADAVMPSITVSATLSGVVVDPKTPPVYTWNAALAFVGSVTPHGSGHNTSHRTIPAQTGPRNSFVIPFTEIRGGVLTVSVSVRVGANTLTAHSIGLTVVGTNPTPAAIKTKANAIGATKVRFRKQMRQESSLMQFTTSGWPHYSSDNLGGVGLCQITNPAPSADQTWDWKRNVDAGWALYREKEVIEQRFVTATRTGTEFRQWVTDWNHSRLPAKPIPVTLPDYTAEQLELDTIRGFNGFANGLHEFRVHRGPAPRRLLVVTLAAGGQSGAAEWERVPVNERGTSGDPHYVEHVEAQADF